MDIKINEETICEKVCNRLRDEIISGAIPANKRLTVKEICERYGVNTMPVRQSFNILCGEKILRNDAYKGVTVLGLDVDYLSQLYEFQSVLEEYMMKKSFSIGYTDKIIENLQAINGKLKALPKTPESSIERIDLNFEFHCMLYSPCVNTLIYEQYCKNYSFIKAARKYYKVTPERNTKSTDEHDKIIDYIASGKIDATLEVAKLHTENAFENCKKSISKKEI